MDRPQTLIRSVTLTTCGETNIPVGRPWAHASPEAMCAVVVFPFVPVMWIDG